MKIAMPKNEEVINQHYGKSRSFAIATINENKVVSIEEKSIEDLQHNHGGLANLLIQEGVDVVITGGIGAGAYDALKESNLEVIRGASGKIETVLEQYLKGELKDRQVMCNHHGQHHHN